MIASYDQAVAFLYGRINYERMGSESYGNSDLKLERMRLLLAALGDPQRQIPVVHVAGTKGKGTVCGLIAAMLQGGGYRVGLYTSPHMTRVEERFVVNGQLPTEEEFVHLCRELAEVIENLDRTHPGLEPTFFECVNALAWMHFRQRQVDLAVLEVGLGGRLDSTNLCHPLVTVITSISYDHTRILGSTLAQIAGEKAGIIKPGIPLICGQLSPEPRQVIHARAAEQKAPLQQYQVDFTSRETRPWSPARRFQELQVEFPEQSLLFEIGFPGPVYTENTAIAAACLRTLSPLGFPVTADDCQRAVRSVALPLRFEILREEPLFIADAAHNPASIRALRNTLKTAFPDRKILLLLAVSRDKDYQAICSELADIERVVVTRYQGNERSLAIDTLVDTLRQQGIRNIRTAETPAQAWELATRLVEPHEIIVATGSLFFAAEIREHVRNLQPLEPLPLIP